MAKKNPRKSRGIFGQRAYGKIPRLEFDTKAAVIKTARSKEAGLAELDG